MKINNYQYYPCWFSLKINVTVNTFLNEIVRNMISVFLSEYFFLYTRAIENFIIKIRHENNADTSQSFWGGKRRD